MLIVDTQNTQKISKDNLYSCYSPNLYKFLKDIKNIEPIKITVHRTRKTKFSLFVKSDNLQAALLEWRMNKEKGVLAIPKIDRGGLND